MLGVATGFPLDLFDLTSGEEKFEDITIPSGGFPLDLLRRSELAVELLVVVTSSIVGRENYKSRVVYICSTRSRRGRRT
jgi:hypothetical protein